MKISELIPDARNANKGTKRGAALIEQSLKEYGAGRSIVIDKNGRIIAGNKTIENAKTAGITEVTVVKTDGSKIVAVQRMDLDLVKDAKAKALAIADNRSGELSLDWNPDILRDLVDVDGIDLTGIGFDSEELAKLLAVDASNDAEVPDAEFERAGALCKAWRVSRGLGWNIPSVAQPGKYHRIMCGDSTSATDVGHLMGTAKAALMATDPPYGVAYGVDTGSDRAARFGAMAGDDNDGPKLQSFHEAVFQNAIPHLRSDAAWYLWHAQMTQGFFAAAAAAAAAQLLVHRQIIWAKSHFILGHGDYHWQHELCFYGWREGNRPKWYGGRDQSTLWEIPNARAHEFHPTQKPVELFTRSMQNNTLPGEVCYEPFSGSGSQLCAAEQVGRICYAMEIEPKYVAVALERLKGMGLQPQREEVPRQKRPLAQAARLAG